MASPTTQTVQNYCNLVAKSKLLSAEAVKEGYRRWQESNNGADGDTDSLRKFFVSRKLLTEYQSHLLMRGHTEGYFLNQYKILEMVGKGRTSGIFKAMHATGQIVSLRVLPSSRAKDPAILSRFQREGNLLTKLEHPNIVRVFQIGEANGRHFFVLEYFESEPLDEILARRQRLSPPEAVRIVYQALLGLQHVFEKGMVHRDLKPSNLALTPPPASGPNETTLLSNVKILDIGLGRTTFDESANLPDPESRLTTEGSLLGTPDYMAPEQARNAHQADIRADIYSLGCVLFHLLAGQPPFPDSNVLAQIVKHATEQPLPLSNFLPQVPSGLQEALNWMMAKDPNQRYPTPARAAQALQAFLPPAADITAPTAPLPAFVQYLHKGLKPETTKTTPVASAPQPPAPTAAPVLPSGAQIPVGRIETDTRRKEPKKEGTGARPKLPAAPAIPAAAPVSAADEYDVEIVGPVPANLAQAPRIEPLDKTAHEDRSLFEVDRRDWIMLGAGGGIVGGALLIGFGLSRLLRSSPSPTSAAEEKQPDATPPPKKPPAKPSEEKKDENKAAEPKKDDTKKEEMKKDSKTNEAE